MSLPVKEELRGATEMFQVLCPRTAAALDRRTHALRSVDIPVGYGDHLNSTAKLFGILSARLFPHF